jgi:murein L,D-transpeptidase YcbB/YkuD
MTRGLSTAAAAALAWWLAGVTLGAGAQPLDALAPGPERTELPGPALGDEASWLARLYGAGQTNLLWVRDGVPTAQGTELLGIIDRVERYGLKPEDYGRALLDASAGAAGTLNADAALRLDVLLSRAALRLVTHLHAGRIDPRAAGFELEPARAALDLEAQLRALAMAPSVAAALQRIEPQFAHYRLLEDALPAYRALAADPSLNALAPPGAQALHAGDAYPDAPALRALLRALGDLPAPPPAPGDALPGTLDAELAAGLRHFQTRHGLAPDGALGPSTYAALRTPLAVRVQQIELTLERWRWLPPFETPPIIVNIPQFQLFAFRTTEDRGANILQMPVIVGRTYPRTRTPVFVGDLQYVVFRPYWDVPHDIAVRELLPEIRSHGDYLQRQSLELVRGAGDEAVPVSPTPEALAALAAGELRLRQRPGADNSLGLIKLVFPNAHDVYMHGTPANQLFLQSRRAFSHGCIRVSDPVALAAHVLRNAADAWTPDQIEAAMHGADARRVALRTPIRVMILYATALATEDGRVLFFDDLYGQDARLEHLLALRGASLAGARH